ncbi:3-oxoadipate enol-lactonase 2 [Shimia thalassica]|uniref:3-oxoadipate enol-lactonase 2 n=1 Tax=Shimia thalassica TaxID=1715693 RepID=A0A0P1IGD7_9RHOB|nr:alpha/beta hydrolase [Shimia thalassica]CUK11664.1 3-oxoadipate enol-lactonase 2 [Shimia thalassica]
MTSTTLQLSDPYGQVTYRDVGQGDPLVLIHGVGMQSAAWDPQIAALSAQCRVIALDMPGHGQSAPLSGTPALPDYVNWLHAVLSALELRSVSLAGHSMGALIAGGYTVTHPENVARVALLNGVFRRSSAAREAVVARAEDIRNGRFDLETPLKRWFGTSETDKAASNLVSGWLSSVDLKGYGDAYAAFAEGDATYADGFRDIACPLLALTGGEDPNSTPDMAKAMASDAPVGHALIIEGARHMVNMTAPGQVNVALAHWLASPVEERKMA